MFGISRRPVGDPWLDLLYNLERRMGRVFIWQKFLLKII